MAQRFGRYNLLEFLASGGMADVYRAELPGEAGFNKELAIKVIRGDFDDRPEFVEMFKQEARLASKLTHANIVQVFDFGKAAGHYFLAMEFVRGRTLGQVADRCRAIGIPLDLPRIAYVCSEVASALSYAHRLKENGKPVGLIHRDVSPQNVLVSFEGEVKLTDFGIARASSAAEKLTRPGIVKGKAAYMAPEQARGLEMDARTDVFALGIVLWELCCGFNLFERDTETASLLAVLGPDPAIAPPSKWNPLIPPELEAAIMGALERDVDKRTASAQQLATQLQAVLLKLAKSPEDMDMQSLMHRLWPEGATAAGVSQQHTVKMPTPPGKLVPSEESFAVVEEPPPAQGESMQPALPSTELLAEEEPSQAAEEGEQQVVAEQEPPYADGGPAARFRAGRLVQPLDRESLYPRAPSEPDTHAGSGPLQLGLSVEMRSPAPQREPVRAPVRAPSTPAPVRAPSTPTPVRAPNTPEPMRFTPGPNTPQPRGAKPVPPTVPWVEPPRAPVQTPARIATKPTGEPARDGDLGETAPAAPAPPRAGRWGPFRMAALAAVVGGTVAVAVVVALRAPAPARSDGGAGAGPAPVQRVPVAPPPAAPAPAATPPGSVVPAPPPGQAQAQPAPSPARIPQSAPAPAAPADTAPPQPLPGDDTAAPATPAARPRPGKSVADARKGGDRQKSSKAGHHGEGDDGSSHAQPSSARVGGEAKLHVVSRSSWAVIFIDGKQAGFTPVSVTLPAGKHHLRAEHEGFKPQEYTIMLEPGGDAMWAPELERGSGG